MTPFKLVRLWTALVRRADKGATKDTGEVQKVATKNTGKGRRVMNQNVKATLRGWL